MNKQELRTKLLAERKKLSSELLDDFSETIQNNILKSDLFVSSDIVLLYSPIKNEVRTEKILETTLNLGKELYLPRVHTSVSEPLMDFYKITSMEDLNTGYMGILEPQYDTSVFSYEDHKDKKILMLVPGVGFDKNFNRLGYGKGYYDNYLKNKGNIFTVGICFNLQIVNNIPVEPNDILLNLVVSETTDLNEINKYFYRGNKC